MMMTVVIYRRPAHASSARRPTDCTREPAAASAFSASSSRSALSLLLGVTDTPTRPLTYLRSESPSFSDGEVPSRCRRGC